MRGLRIERIGGCEKRFETQCLKELWNINGKHHSATAGEAGI